MALDQDQTNVGPDLIQTVLYSDSVPEIILEKIYFEKVSRRQQKHAKLPYMQKVKCNGLPPSQNQITQTGKACIVPDQTDPRRTV